jgi:hypothetical protein
MPSRSTERDQLTTAGFAFGDVDSLLFQGTRGIHLVGRERHFLAGLRKDDVGGHHVLPAPDVIDDAAIDIADFNDH